jgi:hypothetical protein
MFTAQLWHRSTNWLVGLNLKSSINTRKYFRLNDFWGTLYIDPTTFFNTKNSSFLPQNIFRGFVWFSEYVAIISLCK